MVTATARPAARALSVDAAVTRLLARGPGDTRVHSVFRHVITLEAAGGRLVSLCGRDQDDAPWSLRADVEDWAAWEVSPGAAAQASPDTLVLPGGPTVSLRGARAWDPVTASLTATDDQLAARAAELESVLHRDGVPGGALAGPSPDPFAALVAARITAALADIRAGELAGRAQDVEAAASSLVGLGPGLTPAGDDVLSGLALVTSRPGGRTTTVLPALRRTLHRVGSRTTDLSRATLAAALGGRGRQRLLDLVDALVSSDDAGPAALREHARRVVGIGHTSGTDLASGVLAGIQLELQRRGSACLSPQ